MLIAIDTRTAEPLDFKDGERMRAELDFPDTVRTERRDLPAGDYSLPGLEGTFAVKVFELEELLGRLKFARADVDDELKRLRMQRYIFARVVVIGAAVDRMGEHCAGCADFDSCAHAAAAVAALEMQHRVPVVPVGSRQGAARLIELWARYFVEEIRARGLVWQGEP